MTTSSHVRPSSLTVVLVLAGLALAMPAGAAKPDTPQMPAAVAYQTVTSAGPLTDLYLGVDAAAQILHSGDVDWEVYPPDTRPGDYGTFLFIDGVLYAADFTGHGGTATSSIGTNTVLTPVSQTGVTGTGTSGDPYKVVTTVDAGTTGIRVTQTDSYVVGQESYRTDLVLGNSGTASKAVLMYRAMDCYLGGSDVGYGFVTGTGPGCSKNANNSPPGRIEQLVPLSTDNKYYEAHYSTVWSAIGTHNPLPNTCACATSTDNGMAISWELTVPAGGQVTRSHLTVFSPLGTEPLSTAKTADTPTAPAGGTDGYTITIHNPNVVDVALSSITDTLPAGFSYVAGSTTGATTSNPGIAGQVLTWTGPLNVPAGGDLTLHFQVTVSSQAGTYNNEATADGGTYTVAGTGPTAPITVGQAEPTVAIPALGTLGLFLLAGLLAATGTWVALRMRG